MKRFLLVDVSSALHGALPTRSSLDHQAVFALLEQTAVASKQPPPAQSADLFTWYCLAHTRLIANDFGIGGTG